MAYRSQWVSLTANKYRRQTTATDTRPQEKKHRNESGAVRVK